jgi:hypothetical protein
MPLDIWKSWISQHYRMAGEVSPLWILPAPSFGGDMARHPDSEFCELGLTEESLTVHYRLYISMPLYRTSPEFREIVDGTFYAETELVRLMAQSRRDYGTEEVIWQQCKMWGERLKQFNARSIYLGENTPSLEQ